MSLAAIYFHFHLQAGHHYESYTYVNRPERAGRRTVPLEWLQRSQKGMSAGTAAAGSSSDGMLFIRVITVDAAHLSHRHTSQSAERRHAAPPTPSHRTDTENGRRPRYIFQNQAAHLFHLTIVPFRFSVFCPNY